VKSLSLARALSKFGACSRSEAVRRIQAGRVRVDGRLVLRPDRWIDPRRNRVTLDGRRVSDQTDRVVFAFHKPAGVITSRTDPAGRATIYDVLDDLGRWVFPVGRLDRDSSGLLLLTNDHRLGHRLTDPGEGVPKTYHARVRGVPEDGALEVLRDGVRLEDGTLTRPASVRVVGAARGGDTWLEVVLTEGKNRQVRRMCGVVGHDVLELVRVAIGGLTLGDLAPGEVRRLTRDELERLDSRPRRRS
jgi:23S rRNA pseudouridine2605 synthase